MDTNRFNWSVNSKLALGILALWSMGYVVNPLLLAVENESQPMGLLLYFVLFVYIVLHIGVFSYTSSLLARSWRLARRSMQGKRIGVLVLYVYILVTILISLSYLVYRVGYLPSFLGTSYSSIAGSTGHSHSMNNER